VATPLSLSPRQRDESRRVARGRWESPRRTCVNAPRVPFDRMSTLVASCFALNVAPTADPQMVPRTRRSIVRDCTIEWGSSYILNIPNALSPKACLPSCSMNLERRKTHTQCGKGWLASLRAPLCRRSRPGRGRSAVLNGSQSFPRIQVVCTFRLFRLFRRCFCRLEAPGICTRSPASWHSACACSERRYYLSKFAE